MAGKIALVTALIPCRYRRELTPMFVWAKENNIEIERAMEIGVYDGGNAQYILLAYPEMKKFYFIDPWGFEQSPWKEGNFSAGKMARCYNRCNTLKKIFPQIELVPHISETGIPVVVKMLQGELLDAVYIDGVHKAGAVRQDFELSYPLVRKGGIIGGHDFCNLASPKGLNHYVLGELTNKYKRTIHLGLQSRKGTCNNFDWWIVK